MKYKFFVGIDVSKDKLDLCVIDQSLSEQSHHHVVANNEKAFQKLIKQLTSEFGKPDEHWLFCLEHTGVYAMPVCRFLSSLELNYALVPALQIQKSIGIRRGKSDKADSRDIAMYAMLFSSQIKLYKLQEKVLQKLSIWLAQRERLIKCKILLKKASDESTEYLERDVTVGIKSQSQRLIKKMDAEIKKVEDKMLQLVASDKDVKRAYDLISSVPGVGDQTTFHLLVATRCFTSFKNARQLASYCGVAPFEYSSGKSIRGKAKVSHLANKKIKSLLSMCALNAKVSDPQIRQYYQRKVAEGKNPMSVMNAVKNKLLQRIFATVQRGTPYVKVQC